MKVSMWTSVLVELEPEDAIVALRDAGYRYLEFSDEHWRKLNSRATPQKACEKG